MPHLSVEARPKAAPDRGLKRGRAFVEVIDLSDDLDNPRIVYKRIDSREEDEGRKGEKEVKEDEGRPGEKEADGRTGAKNKLTQHWDICSECYSVPFPSGANMFCLKCQNNFKVWYEFCNKFSALERNNYKIWEECFPED